MISLTQVEASWHVQVRTLAKSIDGRNAELVGGLLGEVGDANFCCLNGLSSVASLPCLGANLPPVHDVALDRHRAVAVRRRPLDGDGGLSLVLHHGVHWSVRRMFPCSWSTGVNLCCLSELFKLGFTAVACISEGLTADCVSLEFIC